MKINLRKLTHRKVVQQIALLILFSFPWPCMGAGLELLVSPKTGDIIVAKPAGSPWGTEEFRNFVVLRLTDDVVAKVTDATLRSLLEKLAARLDGIGKKGEPHPVLTLPFAQYVGTRDQIQEGVEFCRLAQQSRQFINMRSADSSFRTALSDAASTGQVIETDETQLAAMIAVRPDPVVAQDELIVNAEDQLK